MGSKLGPEKIVSSEELVRSQIVSNEGIIRLLLKKGIFTKEGFLEIVNVVNLKIRNMVLQAEGGGFGL